MPTRAPGSRVIPPCCALRSRDAQARCVRDAGRLTPDLMQHVPPGMLPSGPTGGQPPYPDPNGPPMGGTAGPIFGPPGGSAGPMPPYPDPDGPPTGGTAGPIGGTAGPMCSCFANSENDETYCESGNFPTPGACDQTTNGRCHWGPAELPQCRVGA